MTLSESDRSLLVETRNFLVAHPVRRCYFRHEDGYRDENGNPTGQDGYLPQCSIKKRHLGCPHLFDMSPGGLSQMWNSTIRPALVVLLAYRFFSQDDYNQLLELSSRLSEADSLMRRARCGVRQFDSKTMSERLLPRDSVVQLEAILYPKVIDPLYNRVEALQEKILTAIEQALSS